MIVLEPYGSHIKPKYDFSFWSLLGLLFAHFVTSYIWFKDQAWNLFSTENFDAYCGALYKNCTSIAAEDISSFQFLFVLYALMSICGLTFLLARKVKIVNWIFIALFAFKFLFLVSRFNLVNSYNEVHLMLCLAYFLSKGVELSYRLILSLQYFLSGIAKLSYAWLSGATLLSLYGFAPTSSFYLILLSYIVSVQVFLVWGLIFGSKFIKRLTLIQLVVLNMLSAYFVGLEYSLMSTLFLLPIIVSDFFLNDEEGIFRGFFESYVLKQIGAALLVLALLFSQNIFTGVKKSFAKSGETKFLDINVIKVTRDCRFRLIKANKGGSFNFEEVDTSNITSCKPAAYQAYLRRLCGKEKGKRIFFQVEEKIKSENLYKEIERYNDVCTTL